MACSYFVRQQVRKVTEMACMPGAACLDLLIQFQCSLIPPFGLSGATSTFCHNRQLVAGPSSTYCITHSLFQCQAFTVAALGLCPLLLFLCHPAQLIPGNRLHCRFTQIMKETKG